MYNIVIADDNYLVAEGLEQNIDWTSLHAVISRKFYDGADVLTYLPQFEADIIITDIMMPRLSGLDMIREILKTRPHIKIIVISAFSDFDYVQKALRLGACDYIQKPLDYEYVFQVLKKTISHIEEERRLHEELMHSKESLTQTFFQGLLHGSPRTTRFHLEKYLPFMQLPLSATNYFCTIITLEQEETGTTSRQDAEKFFISLLRLKEKIKELFVSLPLLHVTLERDYLVAVMGFNAFHERVQRNDINTHFVSLIEDFHHKDFTVNIGIGSQVRELWDVPSSYDNAKRALDYRFFFPQANIFDIRDFAHEQQDIPKPETAFHESLLQAICKGSQQDIHACTVSFETFFNSFKNKKNLMIQMYALCDRLLRFMHDMELSMPDIENRLIALYRDMDLFSSCGVLCHQMEDICLTIALHLQQMKHTRSRQVSTVVMEYIERNYNDNTLSLDTLSQYVDLSPAHLSSIFKLSMGISISDAITDTRIQAAQKLLLNPSLPIKEISEKTGYSNQYYFSSCFKKKTGTTPSVYRDQHLAIR